MKDRRIKLFCWHIHGSYLYYLSQGPFEIYIPLSDTREEGYIGRGSTYPFGPNVHEIHVSEVSNRSFDCILFQSRKNYLVDRFAILSPEQRRLPSIYLEHDPPQGVPTDTQHIISDAAVTLVHVTHFNKLMWDNGRTPAEVIEHGVMIPEVSYSGELDRGIVVVNNLQDRGRRLGYDIFQQVKKQVPLDLVGIDTMKTGGLGEILHPQLPAFISNYRFFFNPIRYTSLGLSVLEAMATGIPVVGLATTETATVIQNDKSGIIHTNIDYLTGRMRGLLADRSEAMRLGAEGKKTVAERFNIGRFTSDWENLFLKVIKQKKITQSEINSENLSVTV